MLCWVLTPIAVLALIAISLVIFFSILYVIGLFVLNVFIGPDNDGPDDIILLGVMSVLVCTAICVIIIPLSFLIHPYVCHLVGFIK